MELRDCIGIVVGQEFVPAADIEMKKCRIAAAQDATDAVDAPLWRSPFHKVGTETVRMKPCHLEARLGTRVDSTRFIIDAGSRSRSQRKRQGVRQNDVSAVDAKDDVFLHHINKPRFTLRTG